MHELVIIETGHIDSRFKHEVKEKKNVYVVFVWKRGERERERERETIWKT